MEDILIPKCILFSNVGGTQEVAKQISGRLELFEMLASHMPFVSLACGNAADFEILYRSLLTP